MNTAKSSISESMKKQVSSAESDSITKRISSRSDKLLQALVSVPERTSLELGITLNVNGLLITGFIISQKTYFESIIQGVKSTQADEEVKDLLEDFLTQLKTPLLENSGDKNLFPEFIHLRNVKIYPSEGRGMPTFGHALWRGDIRAVNGFSLGEMVPAQFDRLTQNA